MAADRGWTRMSVAQAAQQAGLDLPRARQRFPHRAAMLLRFGREADRLARTALTPAAPVRDQLFDMLMRRIDALQTHRGGMLALFRALPTHPAAALLLASASLCSMAWMLEAAGASATGPTGRLRAKGLLAVWLWTIRAWRRDDSVDLAATMAALDQALSRAASAESGLHPRSATPAPEPESMPEPPDEAPPFPDPAPSEPPPPEIPPADIPPDALPPA